MTLWLDTTPPRQVDEVKAYYTHGIQHFCGLEARCAYVTLIGGGTALARLDRLVVRP